MIPLELSASRLFGNSDSRLTLSGQRTHPDGLKVKSRVQVGLSPTRKLPQNGCMSGWAVIWKFPPLRRV
jgi:hypothetical protein